MAKDNQLLVYLLIGVAAYFVITSGALGGLFSSSDSSDTLYPSNLQTTITLNTGDALASSATNANVSYYVFKSDGAYLKEGTTATGTASFTVPTAGNYKLLVYADTGGTDYLPIVKEFSTDGGNPDGRALQTINLELNKESAATINKIRNPIDLDTNVTCGASSSCQFDLLISATSSNAAVRQPIVQIDVNSTEFDNVELGGLSSVACPSRITTSSGRIHYCFQSNSDLKSSDGIVMYSGTLTSSSTGPSSLSTIVATVLDTGIYQDSQYRSKGFLGFNYGPENPKNRADVGAADSSTSTLTVN